MKINNFKRTVVSTALALTLTAGLGAPAGAAFGRLSAEDIKNCLPISTTCRSEWLQELLGCLDWNTPQKPDAPVVPDTPEKPNAPIVPDVPETPDKPDTPSVPDNGGSTDTSVHAYEKAVVDLVNAERAKYGLKPLTLSAELCSGARAKSLDMAQNNYFSHNSPTYGSAFDMMKQFGITYRSAGENIAKGYSTPEAVVNGWMNSEGHRKNILDSGYTTIGVGYVANGNHWTQWFIS